jgi:beta-barrel assembly-enhancing protease
MRRTPQLLVAIVIAGVALLSYFSSRQENPVTGRTQAIAMNQDQEIALGLQSAPGMAREFGGPDADPAAQSRVSGIGRRIVERNSPASQSGYRFSYRLLADRQTINAFALPGGPIFITRALYDRLENDAELAGVLGHETGHVLGRHSSQQIAKSQLFQGLIGAVGVAASDDPGHGQQAAMIAQAVAEMAQLRYGRNDELEADTLGVRFMSDAGYDPRALIKVMDILEKSSGGSGQPEFMSTHPNPGNRREVIKHAIDQKYPNGVPEDLTLGSRAAGRDSS